MRLVVGLLGCCWSRWDLGGTSGKRTIAVSTMRRSRHGCLCLWGLSLILWMKLCCASNANANANRNANSNTITNAEPLALLAPNRQRTGSTQGKDRITLGGIWNNRWRKMATRRRLGILQGGTGSLNFRLRRGGNSLQEEYRKEREETSEDEDDKVGVALTNFREQVREIMSDVREDLRNSLLSLADDIQQVKIRAQPKSQSQLESLQRAMEAAKAEEIQERSKAVAVDMDELSQRQSGRTGTTIGDSNTSTTRKIVDTASQTDEWTNEVSNDTIVDAMLRVQGDAIRLEEGTDRNENNNLDQWFGKRIFSKIIKTSHNEHMDKEAVLNATVGTSDTTKRSTDSNATFTASTKAQLSKQLTSTALKGRKHNKQTSLKSDLLLPSSTDIAALELDVGCDEEFEYRYQNDINCENDKSLDDEDTDTHNEEAKFEGDDTSSALTAKSTKHSVLFLALESLFHSATIAIFVLLACWLAQAVSSIVYGAIVKQL